MRALLAVTAALGLLLAHGPAQAAAARPASTFSGVVLWHSGQAGDAIAVKGHADPLRQRGRLTADTPLHIGSITKLFTAVLVMQQVAGDKLALDTAIGTLMPELPAAAGAVTVRQLLQHRSGLPVFQAEVIEAEGQPLAVVPGIPTEVLSAQVLSVAAAAPRAAPGSPFFYNNLDYLLLGLLLERVSGKPYATLLNERLLKPLAMRSTSLATLPADPRRAASAPDATVEKGRLTPRLPTTIANYGAAGAAVSTARDLSRFAAGLMDGRVLARPLREQLFAEGLSVWAYEFGGAQGAKVAAVERQGAVGSYRSTLVLLPAQRGWMIVLANTDGEDYSTWLPSGFTHRLLAGLLGGRPPAAALAAALQPAAAAPPAQP